MTIPPLRRLCVAGVTRANITINGGSEIRQPFIFDEVPSGWYVGEDLLSINAQQTQTAMRFDWKFVYASVNIPMSELLLNSGSHAVTDLVTNKMQTAEMTIRQRIATSIFSDGTGHGGKELVGLRAAVSNTGSYGGISRTSTEGSVLNSFVDATGGVLTLDLLQRGYGEATIQPEQPDIILTTQRLFDKIWAQVQSAQRFGPNETPGALGAAGFSSIRFNNALVVVDQKCPAGDVYFLNTKWIKMIFHPSRRFGVEGPFPVANQDIKVWRVHSAMALICQSPRLQARLSNLSET